MRFTRRFLAPATAIILSVGASGAHADEAFAEAYRSLLTAGKPAEAAQLASEALSASEGDQQARFALGAAQFLVAVENLGHGLYTYGMRTDYDTNFFGLGLTSLPFLRLPIPQNPNPEPASFEAINGLLMAFTDDLAIAEATLGKVSPEPFELTLDIGTIGLDFDRDGEVSPRESVSSLLSATARQIGQKPELIVDFDQSDAVWLQGYCHLLTAMANGVSGHDWSEAFNLTFHNVFPSADLVGGPLRAAEQETRDRIATFLDADGNPPRWPSFPQGTPWKERQEKTNAWRLSPEGDRYFEYSRLRQTLEGGEIADLIAFVHLFRWPVVDAERVASVRTHLLKMVELSRENWVRIGAETDDAREWVPNINQTGVFPNMRVTQMTRDGWTMFLDRFEAVLNGDLLIPHWRFPDQGVNVRRMFEEPQTLDPVLIMQGVAVLPYLEEGDMTGMGDVNAIFRLFDDGFFRYFIYFN
ncbi:hypothetical protein [Thioclava pacifica]|uniref:Uncharacterized protein n=1 Tax=Thioclava pacifica DSM 10166 TaxID=1353537 RepID=A0A074JY19_9RHOB|nr:hypothetical protein [Thioclava pacifica]KEO54227.1 hypothetical protein TP2_04710 [Thioclava pacifica DSM 10166]